MGDQMKRVLRTAAIPWALCMVFVSSLALADDCRDSLMAESCACQSDVRSEREQRSASDNTSLAKKEARARNRPKARSARAAESSNGPSEKVVVKR
jgi:hypothetical protein